MAKLNNRVLEGTTSFSVEVPLLILMLLFCIIWLQMKNQCRVEWLICINYATEPQTVLDWSTDEILLVWSGALKKTDKDFLNLQSAQTLTHRHTQNYNFQFLKLWKALLWNDWQHTLDSEALLQLEVSKHFVELCSRYCFSVVQVPRCKKKSLIYKNTKLVLKRKFYFAAVYLDVTKRLRWMCHSSILILAYTDYPLCVIFNEEQTIPSMSTNEYKAVF